MAAHLTPDQKVGNSSLSLPSLCFMSGPPIHKQVGNGDGEKLPFRKLLRHETLPKRDAAHAPI